VWYTSKQSTHRYSSSSRLGPDAHSGQCQMVRRRHSLLAQCRVNPCFSGERCGQCTSRDPPLAGALRRPAETRGGAEEEEEEEAVVAEVEEVAAETAAATAAAAAALGLALAFTLALLVPLARGLAVVAGLPTLAVPLLPVATPVLLWCDG